CSDRVRFLSREKNGRPSRDIVPMKGSDFLSEQMRLASALLDMGVGREDRVAIFADNSVRYAAAVFAILSVGAVLVPIYPTTTETEAANIVRHCSPMLIFAGDIAQYQKALPALTAVNSPLRMMITFFPRDRQESNVIDYGEALNRGERAGKAEAVLASLSPLGESDPAALIYTVSSPSNPRGAMLTHGNLLAQRNLSHLLSVGESDTRLAHLPFGHIFGLAEDLMGAALSGATLSISKTFETGEVLENIRRTGPTIICSVPRLYEKMFAHVAGRIRLRPAPIRFLYQKAVRTGRDCFARESAGVPIPRGTRVLKKLFAPVYKNLMKGLNIHNTRLLISAGGALSPAVAEIAGGLGRPIMEGYGLTESLPMLNINPPHRIKPGTLGPPVLGVTERISQDGEVLVKGPMIFSGYYNNKAENEAAFTPDGYYRTGDIGAFDADGHLVITGRLRDRITLSSGQIIRPRNIEKHFENDGFTEYLCTVGENRRYVAALICPEFNALRAYQRQHRLGCETGEQLVRHPAIVELFKGLVSTVNAALPEYERIVKFTLMPDGFSVDTGEISPTFKLRRQFIQEKYAALIDAMYPSGDRTALDI
ncbi:MAG: long-chain fatty acid--CoA ligase, partial [Spirochaetes bacterium]